jgi:tetratricopeptide (TPR) repeat protein
MSSEGQTTNTAQPVEALRHADQPADPRRTSAHLPTFDGWLDYDESIGKAWSLYSSGTSTEATEAAEQALSVATGRITSSTEKEFGDMARALRSAAAAHVISGCGRERSRDFRTALDEYREAARTVGEGMIALLNAATADPGLKGPQIELAAALCRQDYAQEAMAVLVDVRPAIDDGELILRAAAYEVEAKALEAVADYDEAIKKLDVAIQAIESAVGGPQATESDAAGKDGRLRGARGWILRTLGRYTEARPDFEAALAKEPKNWWWIRGLADVDDALGQAANAQKGYASVSRAAKENPSRLDAASFAMFARCHHMMGNQQEAVRQILHSLYLDPGLVSNQFDLALISLKSGAEAALRRYEIGLERSAGKPIPRRYGLLHQARRDFDSELKRTKAEKSKEIEEIGKLLRKAEGEAKGQWERLRASDGQFWRWMKLGAPVSHVYSYLSNPKNYRAFLKTFHRERDGDRLDLGTELTWSLATPGLRPRTWKTQVGELSPESRICHVAVPPDSGSDPAGFSWTLTLIPVRSQTLLLSRFSFETSRVTEAEQAVLSEQLDRDLDQLGKINDELALALQFRRSLVAS